MTGLADLGRYIESHVDAAGDNVFCALPMPGLSVADLVELARHRGTTIALGDHVSLVVPQSLTWVHSAGDDHTRLTFDQETPRVRLQRFVRFSVDVTWAEIRHDLITVGIRGIPLLTQLEMPINWSAK